jgi:hypothetical protein
MEMSGQLHAPTALPPGKAPGTHWIGGWVGSRADLDAMQKRKNLAPGGNGTPTVEPVAHRYTNCLIKDRDNFILPPEQMFRVIQ